jgi:hypothetical protein
MNTKIKIVIVACLCGLSFFFGRLSISSRVVIYSDGAKSEVFPRDVPTYDLPFVYYEFVLENFRRGHSEKALSDLETLLDDSIQRAQHRRPLLSGRRLVEFDRALSKVARYREQYPRHLSVEAGNEQAAVDTFLRSINK